MRRRRSRTPPPRPADVRAPIDGPDRHAGTDHDRLAGYRLVRRIATGERADVYLAAVVDHPGASPTEQPAEDVAERRGLVALRVYDREADAAAITVEVEAMAVASSLPALLDLATLADGRTCVVVERLSGPTLATLSTGAGLTAGEAITVIAPVVAAVHELERHGFAHIRLAMSDVQFDAAGRARLIGTGALRRLDGSTEDPAARTALLRQAYEALARFVGEVATMTRPAGVLEPLRHLVEELVAVRPFRTRADEIERLLFAIAQPAPLAIGGRAPAPTAGGRRHRATVWNGSETPDRGWGPPMSPLTAAPAPLEEPNEPSTPGVPAPRPISGRWLPRALASFDSLVGETVGEGEGDAREPGRARALIERIRSATARRRSALVFGGLMGGAALVLVLTLVPPAETPGTGDSSVVDGPVPTSSVHTDVVSRTEAASSTEVGGNETSRVSSTETDAAVAAGELLRARGACLAELDAACLTGIVQEGSGLDVSDRAALAGERSEATEIPHRDLALEEAEVTGEMGGAWLVRVPYRSPERPPASILVMRSEAGWRLREIFG